MEGDTTRKSDVTLDKHFAFMDYKWLTWKKVNNIFLQDGGEDEEFKWKHFSEKYIMP